MLAPGRRLVVASLVSSLTTPPPPTSPPLPPISATIGMRSLDDAVRDGLGPMALYPDPVLRLSAAPVSLYGTELERFARMLAARMESNAIAASQFGVDARVVILRGAASPTGTLLVLVNPRIVGRSAAARMRPWREICLVFPTGMDVELLRDESVQVEAEGVDGITRVRTLRGEASRALQHELDHLNGVLIVDHAALDELPPTIAALESARHIERQRRAFERPVAPSRSRRRVDSFELRPGPEGEAMPTSVRAAASAARGRAHPLALPHSIDSDRGTI